MYLHLCSTHHNPSDLSDPLQVDSSTYTAPTTEVLLSYPTSLSQVTYSHLPIVFPQNKSLQSHLLICLYSFRVGRYRLFGMLFDGQRGMRRSRSVISRLRDSLF